MIHNNIIMQDKPTARNDYLVRVVCAMKKAFPGHLRSGKPDLVVKAEGVLPLALTFDVCTVA